MTVTFPSAGTPAARRAAARPFAATLGVAVTVFIAVVLVLVGLPAHADTTPSPAPTTPSGEATLTLAPVGNGILSAGTPLAAWITLDNDTTRQYPDATATVSVGADPLTDRSAVSQWLSGDAAARDLDEVATTSIPSAAPGADSSSLAAAPPETPALQNRAPGVYPLLARVPGVGTVLTARSVVTVPGTAAAAPVGVVVPITAGPISTGLLSADQLAELTAADGALTGILDAVAGTSAILAIDPAIPAAIRVLGTAAPETATLWLDRLLGLSNERFALQFGDADVAAQLQSDIQAVLQPTSLQPFMTAANFAAATATATPTPTPTATEAPAGPAYPDLAALIDIDATRSDVYWPLTGTANPAVVAALGAASVASEPPLTLVDSASTEAGAAGAPVAASARAQDAGVLVYDTAVSAALRDAAVAPDIATRGAPLAAATAYLSLSSAQPRPLLVVVDRANDYTRVGLRTAITAVSETPFAAPATLVQLAAAPPSAVTVTDAATSVDRAAAASTLSLDEAALGPFSSILDDPVELLGPERASLLQLLGAGWAPEPEQWAVAIASHRSATVATLDAVGILPPSTTNLISSGAGLGFWVRNDLPWPVNVALTAAPDNLRLEVERTTQVRADAASNKRIEVPVQARVGNGEVTIALQLRSPSGPPIGDAQRVDVNVRADWEGVGIVILSVLVAGLLVLGLVRTVLHRRWLRRQARTPAAGEGASTPAAAGSGASAPAAGASGTTAPAAASEGSA